MAVQQGPLQLRRLTSAQLNAIVPASGEPVWNKDRKVLVVGDGVKAGGRPIRDRVNAREFGVVGDGVVDDTASLQAFWSFLSANGADGQISAGTYKISSQILTQLTNSFAVYCDSDAEFVAAVGFPSGGGMFALGNALVPNQSFKWVGGKFDGKNQPYTDVGSGSGCSMMTINASNCTYCHIELDRTYSGDDWLNTGSDSHLFIGGPSNIYARIGEAIGAPDSAIYISRNFAGTTGQSLDVGGSFYKCNVGIIVKRRFETALVGGTYIDCVTGAAAGTADIQGFASANAGHGYIFNVNAKRCQHPVFLNAVSNVQVYVNAEQMGVSITGYTSPGTSGVQCRGASNVQGFVNVSGMNSAITATVNDSAVFLGPITTDLDGTLQSEKNHFYIKANAIGVPFQESGSGTNDNTFYGKLNGMFSNQPAIIGALTKYDFQVSNIRFSTGGQRVVDNAGSILFQVGEDGSLSKGPRTATGPSYTDDYTGFAARATRTIVTAGTATAEQGSWQLNAAVATFNGGSTRILGALRPGQFTLSTLPAPANYTAHEIDVTDATGGPKRCRSNGTVWQILNTTTTVS